MLREQQCDQSRVLGGGARSEPQPGLRSWVCSEHFCFALKEWCPLAPPSGALAAGLRIDRSGVWADQ